MVKDILRLPLRAVVASSSATRSSRSAQQSPPRSAALADGIATPPTNKTITGQVHRMIAWYDDGKSSTTYYGLDNTNSSSRFIFNGSAKITPKVSMGFGIMIEIEAGGTS